MTKTLRPIVRRVLFIAHPPLRNRESIAAHAREPRHMPETVPPATQGRATRMPKAEPATHTRQLPGYWAECGICASGTNGRALSAPAINRVLCLLNPEMPDPRAAAGGGMVPGGSRTNRLPEGHQELQTFAIERHPGRPT